LRYKFTYRCRMCSAEYVSGESTSPKSLIALVAIITDSRTPAGFETLGDKDQHGCGPDRVGISDLIGCYVTED